MNRQLPRSMSWIIAHSARITVALAVLFTPFGSALAQTVYNVLDYGAHCDGNIDDTVALQNALNLAALNTAAGISTVVLIPSSTGASCVTQTLRVPTGTQLNIQGGLEGRSTNGTGEAEAVLWIGDLPSVVANVRIWGPGVVDANHAVDSGIFSRNAANITIEGGLTITNSIRWPVNLQSTTGVYLTGLTFSNGGASPQCTGDHLTGRYTTECYVNNVTVRNMPTDSCFAFYGGVKNSGITNSDLAGCVHGIQVVSDENQFLPNSNIVIWQNRVHDNEGYGIVVLTLSANAIQSDVIIERNQVWNTRGGGIALNDGAQNSTVRYNTIHHNANDPSARFTEGFVGGIVVKSGNASISNNTIYNEGGTNPGTGILFGNLDCLDTVSLWDNSIYNAAGGPQPLKDAFAGWINPRISFYTNWISGGVNATPRRLPLNSLNGNWACYSFGLPGDIPFAGDLNGDQVPLNMVYRPSEANWYINLVNGADWNPAPTHTRIVQFGLPGDIPQLVYYNRAAHIAVYRPSTGQTLVNTNNQTYNGSNAAVLTGYPAPLEAPPMPPPMEDGNWPRFKFGLPGDVHFEMRLTSEGPLSPVVFRPSNALWHVAADRTGYPAPAAYRVIGFGLVGDIPRVVSYNGVDHIAVYRPSTGQLLVNTTNETYNGSNVLVWPGP